MFDIGDANAQGFLGETGEDEDQSKKSRGEFEGQVSCYYLDDLSYRDLDMHKFILQGYANQQVRAEDETLNREYNLRAPESDKRKQRIFVITEVDQQNLELIFSAFNLNPEMRVEMSLMQHITKLECYVPTEWNDTMVGGDAKPPTKFIFLNLCIRDAQHLERVKNIKIIYDIQDSIMIIFCHKEYARSFETRMIESYRFKKTGVFT